MFSTFGPDPLPLIGATPVAWDFGVVRVGDPVYREFTIANPGHWTLPFMASTDLVSVTVLGDDVGAAERARESALKIFGV